ncbi:MAG: N-acetylmuramoyl-L-alanine amidase [Acidimicrobiales bacterium]
MGAGERDWGLTRRQFLVAAAGAAGAMAGARTRPGAAAGAGAETPVDLGGVPVFPRSEWGGDLRPTGPVPPEPDVRFLLVHHSVDPGNDYGEVDVAGILRGFVQFHTTGRGWPDLAYNFLVDRFGRVWEGRTGSLDGPVAGDATGGNQGFAQLCCFIGNHQVAQPSARAFDTMGRLLAALARRYGVDLAPGATTTFTSRGSNRHPAGAVVTTATVAGHRDMSRTQCPGHLVYTRLPELRALALAAAGGAAVTTAPTTAAAPPPTAAAPATTAPSTTAPSTTAPATASAPSTAVAAPEGDGGGTGPAAAIAGAAVAAAGAASAGVWAKRRHPQEP